MTSRRSGPAAERVPIGNRAAVATSGRPRDGSSPHDHADLRCGQPRGVERAFPHHVRLLADLRDRGAAVRPADPRPGWMVALGPTAAGALPGLRRRPAGAYVRRPRLPGDRGGSVCGSARPRRRIERLECDVLDLSPLADRRFDLVYQPVSTLYLPDVRRCYRQVASVLRPGGLYWSEHWNPVEMQLDPETAWDGRAYRLSKQD